MKLKSENLNYSTNSRLKQKETDGCLTHLFLHFQRSQKLFLCVYSSEEFSHVSAAAAAAPATAAAAAAAASATTDDVSP